MCCFINKATLQAAQTRTYQAEMLILVQAAEPERAKLRKPTNALRKMATNNTRNTRNAASPEPNEGDGLLLNLSDMLAAAAAAKPAKVAAAAKPQAQPVAWSPATIAAAAALPIAVELPSRYPAKGPGAQMAEPGFIAAPKDLEALNQPAAPERRNDALLTAIRSALRNDWHGQRLYAGPAATDGGCLPLPVLLTVLATQPEQQKARKWAQTLTTSGQTCIIAQAANVAGRFVICRPEGITLVRDFYAAAT